jgi:hypothetical protein
MAVFAQGGSMVDEIQELRDRGEFLEAVVKLREIIEADGRRAGRLCRRHVFGSRCLLLEAAGKRSEVARTLAELRQFAKAALSLLGLPPQGYGRLLETRLVIVEAVLDGDLTDEAIEQSLEFAATQYGQCWGYQAVVNGTRTVGGGGEAALVRRLPNDRMRDLVRRIADRLGGQHPGLLLAAETLLLLCRDLPVGGGQAGASPLPGEHGVLSASVHESVGGGGVN